MTQLASLSFRARLTLRWTAAFGLLLALTFVVIYIALRTYAYRDLDAQLRTLAATELASATDERLGMHLHEFRVDALASAEYAGKFVQLYGPDRQLLRESSPLAGTGFRIPSDVLTSATEGAAPIVDVRVAGRRGRLAALRTIKDDGRYVIAVGLYVDRLEDSLAHLGWLLGTAWAGAVGLTALLGYLLASRALLPIQRITERAAGIARGNFATRLDPAAVDDEIGRMTTLLNEVLERMHRAIEANRHFAADASHELRGPLTSMAGEIDVTLKRDRSAAEYRETLELVRERLGELAALADSLMVLVRAQEQSRDPVVKEVSVVPLFEASAQRMAPLAKLRRVRIAFDQFPDLIVYGDERLLARVVDNLIGNAVQYNRDGGEVLVRGHVHDAAPDVWESCSAVVTVSDTGPGIAPDQWSRVFERFHRVDQSRSRRTGGTGLGLALCEAIVTLFRGTIRVAESSGRGTTFEVRLPGRAGSGAPRTGALV